MVSQTDDLDEGNAPTRRRALLGSLSLGVAALGAGYTSYAVKQYRDHSEYVPARVDKEFGADPGLFGSNNNGAGNNSGNNSGTAMVMPDAQAIAEQQKTFSRRDAINAGPMRLIVPSVQINAPVVNISSASAWNASSGRTEEMFRIPDNAQVVGHWNKSADLKATHGAVVLAGHVDDAQRRPGALKPISGCAQGDLVWVTDAKGVPHLFAIAGLREYHKRDLPPGIIDQSGPLRLVLVTCGGPIENKRFRDNIVALALPVPVPATSTV